MRLFCLIPNYVFIAKIVENDQKIGSIDCDDLIGTYHDNFTYDLPVILQYFDKEEWIEDSVCCFTTPAEAKQYLDEESVMIAFETQDPEFVKINANEYFQYLKTKVNFELAIDKALEKDEDQKCQMLTQAFEQFEDNMVTKIANPRNFYDTLVVVPDIAISSIKAICATDKNRYAREASLKNYNMIIEKTKKEDLAPKRPNIKIYQEK